MILFIIHFAATWFMVGLIWMVQIVHYPLFAHVGRQDFPYYERLHTTRITWIVLPVMLAEATTGALLACYESHVASWVNVVLLVLIWMSTFFFQVPLHNKLQEDYDSVAHQRLVLTNWFRTVAWTSRGLLLTYLLIELVGSKNFQA